MRELSLLFCGLLSCVTCWSGEKTVCHCADTGVCVLPAGECDSVGRPVVTPLAGVVGRTHRVIRQDAWYGGRRTVFDFEGYEAWVVEPPEDVPVAAGKPWTWTMQWKTAFVPRTAVPVLLKRGWHHVTIDTFERRMDAEGLRVSAAFQKYLVDELGLAKRANLIGLSWGGFFSTRYAATFPQNVAKIYLDCPLLNLGCRRGNAGIGPWAKDAPADWTDDPRMPINMVKPIADAKIPVLLVYGGADSVLNPKLSSEIFIRRLKAAGGEIKVVYRALYGHHPHGFEAGETVVSDFFLRAVQGRTGSTVASGCREHARCEQDYWFVVNEDNDHFFKLPSEEMTVKGLTDYADYVARGKVTHGMWGKGSPVK